MKLGLMRLRLWWVLLCTFTLLACASGPKQVFHSFHIDGRYDGKPNAEGRYEGWGKEIDLLAYSYGDQYRMVRNSVDEPRSPIYKGLTALPFGPSGVSGPMPVGEFLYVKWRIKATGAVFEDRVDLRERLPKNMTNHTLTFVPDKQQLHVFVVTPFPRNPNDEKYTVPKYPYVNFYKPTHLTRLSTSDMTYEIYPVLEPYPAPTHLTSEQVEKCLRGEFLCSVDKPKK